MEAKDAWNKIVSSLYDNEQEFPTTPKTNREPVWFSAVSDGRDVYICSANNHRPSSKITMPRKLSFEHNFIKVYPLFLKREEGFAVSAEATSVTVNQVYYYSLMKHLL
jgi:hypothetical protein